MASDSNRISAEDARLLIGNGEGRPLDLRDHEQVADAHIPGAIATDPDDLETAIERATREDAEVTMVVVSDDDDRSDEVVERLREMGHEAVTLEGGFSSWVEEGARTDPQTPEYEGPELKHPGADIGTTPDPEETEEGDDAEGADGAETGEEGPAQTGEGEAGEGELSGPVSDSDEQDSD